MEKQKEILRHVPELDGVRGIAVLLVMMAHFYAPIGLHLHKVAFDRIFVQGRSGVDLFFVLSGYLITSILVSTKGATNYFKAFYGRRALRILPLYCVFLIGFFWIVVPASHHLGKALAVHTSDQIYYWFFVQNWFQILPHSNAGELMHFWSLAIEEQFYIAWSVVVCFASLPAIRRFSLAVAAGSVLLHITLIFAGASAVFLDRSTFTQVEGLALGSLLATSPWFRSKVGSYAFAALIAGALGILLLPYRAFDFLPCDLAAVSLVAIALTRATPLLTLPWLRRAGKYSFGLYVIHFPIASAVAGILKGAHWVALAAVAIPLACALSFFLTYLSWRFLEEPFLRLKNRFNYHFPTQHIQFSPMDKAA